jgi:large subunit ribosomal protein L6
MSRIGKVPVNIPAGVSINAADGVISVKGQNGELSQVLSEYITVNIDGDVLTVLRKDDSKEARAHHGLYRSLINNMIAGVSVGYTKEMELVGVGYRAASQGQNLELSIGFSHNVMVHLPNEIAVQAVMERGQNPKITLKSHDKQLLGMVAAKIRSLRKPEPYKGKGIKFTDEVIRRKAGKTASKK